MDTQTGEIHSHEDFQKMLAKTPIADRGRFKQMEVEPTPVQMLRKLPRIARNEICPCGSGQKFKKCCLRNKQDARFK